VLSSIRLPPIDILVTSSSSQGRCVQEVLRTAFRLDVSGILMEIWFAQVSQTLTAWG